MKKRKTLEEKAIEKFFNEIPDKNKDELNKYLSKKEYYNDDSVSAVIDCIIKREQDLQSENQTEDDLPLQPLIDIVAFNVKKWKYRDLKSDYERRIPNKLKNNPEFLKRLCSDRPPLVYELFDRIIKIDGLIFEIIDENFDAIKHCILTNHYPQFPTYIKKYIGKKDPTFKPNDIEYALECNEFEATQKSWHSNLYDRLYSRYGKSFNEKFKDKDVDLSDKIFFMYNMLKSNVLEQIYADNRYTVADIGFISNGFLSYLEYPEFEMKEKYPTDQIRQAMEHYRRKYAAIALEQYNKFVANKNNEQALTQLVQELGIKKDKIFEFIKGQKYWSKQQKEFVATLLSSYFKTGDVLTIYDVVDLLEEMEERNLTKQQILDERNIDSKYFEKVYAACKESNPELFELIQQKFKNNSLKGFKKLLILYRSLMNSKIVDVDAFKEKYKMTPDRALELFKNTKLYSDVYNKISSWYNLNTEKTVDREQAVDMMISQMENNRLDVNGNSLDKNQETQEATSINQNKGFAKISLLVLFTSVISVGIIILGVLLK